MTEDAGNDHDRAIDPDRIVPHDATESIPIAPVAGLIPIIVPVGSERATDTGFAAAVDTAVETAIETAVDPAPEVGATPAALPVPAGWSDPVTGNDGPAFWDRIVLTEHARVRRYKRPATIAFVEVVGLDGFALKWGPAIAQRLLVRIGRTLAQEIRSSDCSARIEPSRIRGAPHGDRRDRGDQLRRTGACRVRGADQSRWTGPADRDRLVEPVVEGPRSRARHGCCAPRGRSRARRLDRSPPVSTTGCACRIGWWRSAPGVARPPAGHRR